MSTDTYNRVFAGDHEPSRHGRLRRQAREVLDYLRQQEAHSHPPDRRELDADPLWIDILLKLV